MVFNFQSFSWLWVLWLSNQLKGDVFKQVGHQLKGECLGMFVNLLAFGMGSTWILGQFG